MSIVKKNNFIIGPPAQNLSNMGENVDLNAFGTDQTYITVNFGTTPATVTVKVGSIIEVNGARYDIEGSDEVFQMALATDKYITFTDSGTPAFDSAASKGTWDTAKQGLYDGTNLIRTLRWYVDQVGETVRISEDIIFDDGDIVSEKDRYFLDKINVVDVTESDGGLEVGNTGTVFSEIVELSGTTANANTTNITYPSGFTYLNTHVLALKIYNSSTSAYDSLGTYETGYTDSIFTTFINSASFIINHTETRHKQQLYKIVVARI